MSKFDLERVLENAAKKTILREIPGIKKIFISDDEKHETALTTDGFNITVTIKYLFIKLINT